MCLEYNTEVIVHWGKKVLVLGCCRSQWLSGTKEVFTHLPTCCSSSAQRKAQIFLLCYIWHFFFLYYENTHFITLILWKLHEFSKALTSDIRQTDKEPLHNGTWHREEDALFLCLLKKISNVTPASVSNVVLLLKCEPFL